ncbi:MAG: hypothetical protein ACQCN6_07995 [Candidatus Bathyarchaeia archaeon]|jgi:predicted short-subunit dehydrogenase-like oxidoreductase (DUF2520 family)
MGTSVAQGDWGVVESSSAAVEAMKGRLSAGRRVNVISRMAMMWLALFIDVHPLYELLVK